MYGNKKRTGKGFKGKESYNYRAKENSFKHNSGMPMPDQVSSYSDKLTAKTSRSSYSPIQTRLTPTESVVGEANPYALLAKRNQSADVNYNGQENLSGNTVVQLQDVNLPALTAIDDCMKIGLKVNYNYYRMNGDNREGTKSMNNYAGDSFIDAFSTVQSNIFTELPYFSDNRKIYDEPSFKANFTKNGGAKFENIHDKLWVSAGGEGHWTNPIYEFVSDENPINGDLIPADPDGILIVEIAVDSVSGKNILVTAHDSVEEFLDEVVTTYAGYDSMTEGDVDNRLQEMVFYQTLLQSLAAIPNAYNQLMAMEKHLCNMEYDRNSAKLNTLFGLLKKAAIKGKVETFNRVLEQHYFDPKWYAQWAPLAFAPSRNSDSMRDPLITATVKQSCPFVEVGSWYEDPTGTPNFTTEYNSLYFSKGVEVKDLSELNPDLYDYINDNTDDEFNPTIIINPGKSFNELCYQAVNKLNMYNILKFVRDDNVDGDDIRGYVNQWIYDLDDILIIANSISGVFRKLTTMLNIAVKSGFCDWKQGVSFPLIKDDSYQPKANKLLEDIIKAALIRVGKIKWDDHTLNWTYKTLWDEFAGISAFDKTSGGFLIPLSMNEVDLSGNSMGLRVIPEFIDSDDDSDYRNYGIKVMSRDGVESTITTANVTSDPMIKRLLPLGVTADFSLYVPKMHGGTGYTSAEESRLIAKLFKIGVVGDNTIVNPDLVCAIDIHVGDINDACIRFAKETAPIKVLRSSVKAGIGFTGI